MWTGDNCAQTVTTKPGFRGLGFRVMGLRFKLFVSVVKTNNIIDNWATIIYYNTALDLILCIYYSTISLILAISCVDIAKTPILE